MRWVNAVSSLIQSGKLKLGTPVLMLSIIHIVKLYFRTVPISLQY
jgi:hypothetical protein